MRVLQERKFTPVGSNREIEMDVRIIAATNRNLEDMIKLGTFREDLFYRLNVIPIYLPPLRERKDDIENLVKYFISKFANTHQKKVNALAPSAMNTLLKHGFPGNIRELENIIEHALVIENTETITVQSLPSHLRNGTSESIAAKPISAESEAVVGGDELLDYHAFKEEFEKAFIIKALKTFRGKINQTALHAKIPKKTLLRKLQKYGIKADDYRA